MALVADGSMDAEEAAKLVTDVDESGPIFDRMTFIRYLAAMRAHWLEDGDRRLPTGATTVRQVLVNACIPSRIEWLFNFRRYLTTVNTKRRDAIAAGTTSNEAFHRELNMVHGPKRPPPPSALPGTSPHQPGPTLRSIAKRAKGWGEDGGAGTFQREVGGECICDPRLYRDVFQEATSRATRPLPIRPPDQL